MVPPTVSIIATCHNDVNSVATLFDDLGNLTYQAFQLIVVDDGSTDGTGDAVEEFSSRRPRTETILLEQNLGVARARNLALTAAVGDYVWFVDSGDRLPPDGLLGLVQAALESGADLVFARALEVSGTAGATSTRTIDGLIAPGSKDVGAVAVALARGELRGFLWSKLIRRTCIRYDVFPDVAAQSDFLGLMKILEYTIVHEVIEEVVYHYIRAGASITSRTDPLETLLRSEESFAALRRVREIDLPDTDLTEFHSVWVVLAALDTLARNGLLDKANEQRIRGELRNVSWSSLVFNRRRGSVKTVRLMLAKANLRIYVSASRWARRIASARLRRGGVDIEAA